MNTKKPNRFTRKLGLSIVDVLTRLMGLIIWLAALAFLCVWTVKIWHNYQPPPTTEVIVLRDVTGIDAARPASASVLDLFAAVNGERWQGSVFRYADITDVSYNSSESVVIPPANKWLSNELTRDAEIVTFTQRLGEILSETRLDTSGRPYSSVYLAIARQLEGLSKSNAEKKVLIVYSDLMENTPEVSFYDDRSLAVLRERPDKILQALEAREKLPTLAGIEVYLIYQPGDAADDARFETVSAFYKRLLESKGAVVHIAANLVP